MSTPANLSPQPLVLRYRREDDATQAVLSFTGEFEWLSNFAECQVTLAAEPEHGIPAYPYRTTENAYMAAKVLNPSLRETLQTLTASEAKKLSNTPDFEAQHRPEYSDNWRLQTMLDLNRQKYSKQNPQLRAKLLATGNTTLIEGTTWGDKFFGVCMKTGEGKNYLGRLIMLCRDEIRHEEGLPPLYQAPLLPVGIL